MRSVDAALPHNADELTSPELVLTYLDHWKALAARINGLTRAGDLYTRTLSVRWADMYGTSQTLCEQARGVSQALRVFRSNFEGHLPSPAVAAVDNLLSQVEPLLADQNSATQTLHMRVLAALIMLGAFESEMSHLLSDVQASIRATSERAFAHLQRSIVVDEDLRAKWKTAFASGEVACERLGATHLLAHGIWAFKVDAAGARTDLVFQEPIADLTAEERYSQGIILTEWKKASTDAEAAKKFEEARDQAARYADGPLASVELAGYRYAVVVSKGQVAVPSDVRDANGVIYRHVNIAVNPAVPSRA